MGLFGGLLGGLFGGGFGGGPFLSTPPRPAPLPAPLPAPALGTSFLTAPPAVRGVPSGFMPPGMPGTRATPLAAPLPNANAAGVLSNGNPNSMGFQINRVANKIGADPLDLATAIGYETRWTFDPWVKGPTTKWGTMRGLIQMGEPQREQFGYAKNNTLAQNMDAVGNYLTANGYKPGMGLPQLYSTINAGSPFRLNASDRPGQTVMTHVKDMTQPQNIAKAQGVLDQSGLPSLASTPDVWPMGAPPNNPYLMSPAARSWVQNHGMAQPGASAPAAPPAQVATASPSAAASSIQPLQPAAYNPSNQQQGQGSSMPSAALPPPGPNYTGNYNLPPVPPPPPLPNPIRVNPVLPVDTQQLPPIPVRPPEMQIYGLQPGDNPWTVAKQFGVPWMALLQANNIPINGGRSLPVGYQLNIPRGY